MIETQPGWIGERVRQRRGKWEVESFRQALGPFVVAAEATRMAMTFTNATVAGNPIIFANDSFLALTGFTCEDVVGRSFNFLMSQVADPDSVAKIDGQFAEQSIETIEVECRRKDGRTCLVAMRINPVHDRDGQIVQHCVSFVDLSAHIERMRQEREALHALYQHMPDFIATTQGAEHRFTFANDAFQRLVGNRGIFGQTVADAMPELGAQGFVALLGKVFATGQSLAGRGVAVSLRRGDGRDGETRFVDFICQAVRAPDDEITGIFCEGHDVTDQKLAAEKMQLLEAEVIHLARVSAMGTIAATLAHELSQPLTVISNQAELCCRLVDGDVAKDARLVDGLRAVSDSAMRAREIIKRLKGMTKRAKSEQSLFDLKDLVGETLDLLRIGACGSTLLVDRSVDGISLEGDRVQIQQVIVNLVKNGCEASAARGAGRVTITTSVEKGGAIVSVADNGHGVSPDSRAALFDWSDSTKSDGMGIGLSICRTIINAHGGDIWLENSGAQGSCFRFSLPLDHHENDKASREASSESNNQPFE